MIVRWNPFVPVKNSEQRSVFDSFFNDNFFENFFTSLGVHQTKNEDGTYSMSVDIPGIKEEDISLSLEDNVVTIKGERKTPTSSYMMNKSFTLPEDSDIDTLKAELKDGVLTINLEAKQLPQAKEPKKIPIKTT